MAEKPKDPAAEKKADAPKEKPAAEKKADAPKEPEQSNQKEPSKAGKNVPLEGRGGILGVKAGMTQVYDDSGEVFGVTVIDLRPNVVTQVRTEDRDGYSGVQIGFLEKKESKANKPEKGHLKKSKQKGFYHYQEFRLPKGAKLEGLAPGATLSAEFLKEGDLVDLTSVSKGKGFQGVMKKFHFSGSPATHGASIVHRMPGSIGNRADPSKVFKGKKMAGQMGNEKVTVQNVKVIRHDTKNNLLLVHGSVPGPKSGIVSVRKAIKSESVQGY